MFFPKEIKKRGNESVIMSDSNIWAKKNLGIVESVKACERWEGIVKLIVHREKRRP